MTRSESPKKKRFPNNLYHNPVGWSRRAAGSMPRLILFSIVQTASTGMMLLTVIHRFLKRCSCGGLADVSGFDAFVLYTILLMIAAVFPLMFLYAIHRLVRIIDLQAESKASEFLGSSAEHEPNQKNS